MVLHLVVSLDVLLFYVFPSKPMLIPMYFLIGGFGGGSYISRAAVSSAVTTVRRSDHAGRGDRLYVVTAKTARAPSTSVRSSRRHLGFAGRRLRP